MCPKTASDRKLIVSRSRLNGKVKLSGAKNSALKLLAASLLTDEDIYLSNSPNNIIDMRVHIEMLQLLGKNCIVDGSDLAIKYGGRIKDDLKWEGETIRNTLLIFGALLARNKKASVPLPGGCKIGDRKHDIHLMILRKLGAEIWEEKGSLFGEAAKGLKGTDLILPIRSTGATENGIIAACIAKGTTVIWGPHIRPEILDLIRFLRSMGADIEVNGQENIIIKGVKSLSGTRHNVIMDNMEAMTYLVGAAITGGDVMIEDFPFKDLDVPLIFLRESGVKFYKDENCLLVRGDRCFPVEISTGPYPGINSDMQPLFAVYGMCAKGESRIVDLRFQGRFAYAGELKKLGGSLCVKNNMLVVNGGQKLKGAKVNALDLRCGAALVLAGLISEGQTTILKAHQIERGYEEIDAKLSSLGGKVKFV